MAFGSIWVLWNKWNIRGFIMLSLWLQIFLILFPPLRKKTANRFIISLLWLAYLMADWVAAFAIGLISHNQSSSSTHAAEVDGALQAFWASFLLLHLGGPDTITAFSIEDSSLWRRHLLSLIFQIGSAIHVFVQIFPKDNTLVIPTILVFLAGVIKNTERTVALNFSSLSKLKEWVLSQREDADDVADKFERDSIISQLESSGDEEPKLHESTVVKHAYYFFQMFMVLLGDLMVTSKERKLSYKYFHKVPAMDALRVISAELQFVYEVLYTKTLAIRSKWSYIFRFIAFTNVAMAFHWFNHLKKHQLLEIDVQITYSLLFGGIALDVIALLMLVFSDWTIVGIERVSFLNKFIAATNDLRKPRFATCGAQPNTDVIYTALDTPLIFRRWSESISACNLLSEFTKKTPKNMWKHDLCSGIIRRWGIIRDRCRDINRDISNRFFSIFAVSNDDNGNQDSNIIRDQRYGIITVPFLWAKDIIFCCLLTPLILYLSIKSAFGSFKIHRIANTKYVSKNPFVKELWIFIFTEVKRKSEEVKDDDAKVKKIFEAKGDLFLESEPWGINCRDFLHYVTQVNFDASIIIWHIATEIWYNIEKPIAKNEEREFSKILSDYMMYLLLNQPNLVSAVAGIAQIRSALTVNEMRVLDLFNFSYSDVELCERWFGFTDENAESAFYQGNSAFYQGIKLARQMGSLGDMKWQVMSRLWVEMLSYTASHIKGEAHVQVLSKGGELLVFVWLLMAHFGCFYKPEWGICANYDRLVLKPRS